MNDLERHFATMSQEKIARWWVGDRPSCRDEELIQAILTQVGLPLSDHDSDVTDSLRPLSFSDAAYVLALAGTTSLVWDRRGPTAESVRKCKHVLAPFNQSPKFLTNGNWAEGSNRSWNPLTKATFDCGVIGWDRKSAFVFCVEEED